MRSTSALLVPVSVILFACGGDPSSGAGGGGGGAGGAGGQGGGCADGAAPSPGVVVTGSGAVKGAKVGKTRVYKGVPYAAPPVGDLRWRRATPHPCWEDVRQTLEYGASCLQLDADGKVQGSEDCLTVNLWIPADATPEAPVPVMVFLHGGGNSQGSSAVKVGNTFLYDGQFLSERGQVAVVTINYRLGAMGWLAHPALAEGEPASAGNYGALDQVAALQWAQENLAAFGADPSRVLLFGESAGGQDVCTLLASPLAKGLFSAALIESGGCAVAKAEDAKTFALGWADKAGCSAAADLAACLRALPAEMVTSLVPAPVEVAGKQGPYQPIADGYLLSAQPLDLIKQGKHNHVPLIMGTNEQETGAAVPPTMTEAEYAAAVQALLPTLVDPVLAEYPASAFPAPRDAFVAVTSDAKFICPTRRALRAAAQAQTEPVYRYQFTHVLDQAGPALKARGAFHGLELFFVFGALDAGGYKPSPAEKALSTTIAGYWAHFAKFGTPNGGSAVKWPAFQPATDDYLEIDTVLAAKQGVHTKHCDFWDGLLP